jgi:hypothetical protein
VRDERVDGADVVADHLGQFAGAAPGEPADRHPAEPVGELTAEGQLHVGVEQVPDPGGRGREHEPDEHPGRAEDDDGPDVVVVDGCR